MPYTKQEEQRIKLLAKRALGEMQKASASDRRIFMQQCIDQLTSSGEADDEDDARDICELMWDEGDDLGDLED